MTTYRERREARAERLRGWAEKREAKSEIMFDRAHQMADAIPFGQPILVGHHSEGRDRNYRKRIGSTMDARPLGTDRCRAGAVGIAGEALPLPTRKSTAKARWSLPPAPTTARPSTEHTAGTPLPQRPTGIDDATARTPQV